MRRFLTSTLIFLWCLLCILASAQDVTVVRVGVAPVRGPSKEISAIETRDRLMDLLNRREPIAQKNSSVEAVGLGASAGDPRADAREKNCQFVLYTRLTDLATSEKLLGQSESEVVVAITARVEYRLKSAFSGEDYAFGTAQGESASSKEETLSQAMSRIAEQILADLARGRARSEPESATGGRVDSNPRNGTEEGLMAKDFCAWLIAGLPHADALHGVCQYAISLPQRMPNFICDQATKRYRGRMDFPTDSITAMLRFEDGRESHSEVKINGRPAPPAMVETLLGLWSTGEFGGNLRSIFDVSNQPVFEFSGEKRWGKRSAWVFQFRIAEQKQPHWWLNSDNQKLAPPYGGELWVDQKTGDLLRFRVAASDLPPTFPTQHVESFTDYSEMGFDDGTSFVLPVKSDVASRYRGVATRNVVQFRSCHKFRAKARMVIPPN